MASHFAGRAGFGVGVGLAPAGPGGSFFAQADAFPLRNFGLGIEGEAGGAFNWGNRSSLRALRGRISLRFPISARWLFAGAVSAGVGHVEAETTSGPDPCTQIETECDPGYFGSGPNKHYEGVSFTGALELAFRHHGENAEFGLFIRASGADNSAFVVLGPSLGFAL